MKTTSEESKFTVASILSSMANGHGISQFSPVYENTLTPTSVSTASTPLLTPSTMANIEQTFIELSSVPAHASQSNMHQSNITLQRAQSGFVPPVIAQAVYSDESSNDQDWYTPPAKRVRSEYSVNGSAILIAPDSTSNRRRPTGPRRRKHEEQLTVEEESRRGVRRERNKLAAAKCRQRRVDQTNVLTQETEELEEVKANLENELETLQQVKEHLEFVLQAHNPLCKKHKPDIKTESSYTSCTSESCTTATTTTAVPTARPTSLALPTATLPSVSEAGIPITTPSSIFPAFTPSSMITTLGLDNLIDHTGLTPLTGGRTGLTPLLNGSTGLTPLLNGGRTGLTPLLSGSTGLTPLLFGGRTGLTPLLSGSTGLTPILSGSTGLTPITSGPASNCGIQQRESDGSSPENQLNSPTGRNLITL